MKTTLFLDRDGVINHKIHGYVGTWDKFVFLDRVLEAMPILARKFDYIIIVTNQQGVGKGLMTQEDLDSVHAQMLVEIEKVGGRIDKIFACTCLATAVPNCRKPHPQMALDAQKAFPDIDFDSSIMVGDMHTDCQMAQAVGMPFIWVDTHTDLTDGERAFLIENTDRNYSGLWDWCQSL